MNVEVSFLLFFTKSWHGNVMCVSSQFFHPKWHQALPGERQINITDKTPQTSMTSHSCYNKERSVFGKNKPYSGLRDPHKVPKHFWLVRFQKLSMTFQLPLMKFPLSFTFFEIPISDILLVLCHVISLYDILETYHAPAPKMQTHTHSDSPAPSLLQQLLDEQEGGSAKTIKLQFLTLICTIWKWWE